MQCNAMTPMQTDSSKYQIHDKKLRLHDPHFPPGNRERHNPQIPCENEAKITHSTR